MNKKILHTRSLSNDNIKKKYISLPMFKLKITTPHRCFKVQKLVEPYDKELSYVSKK